MDDLACDLFWVTPLVKSLHKKKWKTNDVIEFGDFSKIPL